MHFLAFVSLPKSYEIYESFYLKKNYRIGHLQQKPNVRQCSIDVIFLLLLHSYTYQKRIGLKLVAWFFGFRRFRAKTKSQIADFK